LITNILSNIFSYTGLERLTYPLNINITEMLLHCFSVAGLIVLDLLLLYFF